VARSDAATPDAYLAELEPQLAAELARVRDTVNAALPDGYVERMAWGMISWEVPLEVSGPTYNKQPLVYAALAAQKNYNALYLNCTYASAERTDRLREAFAQRGQTLTTGGAEEQQFALPELHLFLEGTGREVQRRIRRLRQEARHGQELHPLQTRRRFAAGRDRARGPLDDSRGIRAGQRRRARLTFIRGRRFGCVPAPGAARNIG
jgi:hypothetical protein